MSLRREQIPAHVEAAIDASWRALGEAEDAQIAREEARPIRLVRPRTIWLSDAVTVLGRTDRCPRCGFYIPVCDMRDGHELRECDECRLVVESAP